jgi:bifunctional UDP-N-acetylglucosamine pyrophosphorylase/glucosamine-1-phosphate N-acetyltransferase
MNKPLHVLILAAGKGTRMKSRMPKVMHPLLGRPMLAPVLDLARGLKASRRAVVVGFGAEEVASFLPAGEFEIVRQEEQLGTGHAVARARRLLTSGGDLLVLSGDTPLLKAATLRRLLAGHRRKAAAATLLTAEVGDPTGYGRIVRGRGRRLEAIVEEKDATPAQRLLREVNTGVYCFDTRFLKTALGRIGRDNRQGEYYLTDVIAIAVAAGRPVAAVRAGDPDEILGINSRVELAYAEAILRGRKLESLMRAGVTVVDPSSTWVEERVRVGADTVLLPGTFLEGETRVGRRCRIGPSARIRHSVTGPDVLVRDFCVIENAKIGPSCRIGPFAHLRPGSILDRGAKIGNFVEVKGSRIGKGSKVNHLSYVGDAVVGRDVNVGAGSITCNYDGVRKWRTVIEDGAFVGSGSQLVAPLRVGRGSLVGAGSTVTRDVPPGSLALARTPQENREGMAARYLGKKKRK